eukprot:6205483-Pleurochrysis_carterae.AAC.2
MMCYFQSAYGGEKIVHLACSSPVHRSPPASSVSSTLIAISRQAAFPGCSSFGAPTNQRLPRHEYGSS